MVSRESYGPPLPATHYIQVSCVHLFLIIIGGIVTRYLTRHDDSIVDIPFPEIRT